MNLIIKDQLNGFYDLINTPYLVSVSGPIVVDVLK